MSAAAPLFHGPLHLLKRTAQGILWLHLFYDHAYAVGYPVGASMMPTFNIADDLCLISKFHKRGRGIEVGDLVSYLHPTVGPDTSVIKRVIGLPGDFVVKDPTDESEEMLQVPPGHLWTCGDNIPHSRDSRHYGPVPMALVRGKVVARVDGENWWKGFQRIKNPLKDEK